MTQPALLKKTEASLFQRCRSIDCSQIIRSNYQGAKYISWADMWDLLYQNFPEAKVEWARWNDSPFLKTELGYFVECAVTIENVSRVSLLPVMGGDMKAIESPDARDISDNMMRCFVKACALHGLGLECWEKEDPLNAKETIPKTKTQIRRDDKVENQTPSSTELRASFGKYKNKSITEIPDSYFEWLSKDAQLKQQPLKGEALQLYKAWEILKKTREIVPMDEEPPPFDKDFDLPF